MVDGHKNKLRTLEVAEWSQMLYLDRDTAGHFWSGRMP